MEKRLTLAFVLSLATIIVWSLLNPPADPPPEDPSKTGTQNEQGSSEKESGGPAPSGGDQKPPSGATPSEKPAETNPAEAISVLAPNDARRIVLENDLLRLVFSNRGGVLERAELKDHHGTVKAREAGKPLPILREVGADVFAMQLDDQAFPQLAKVEWDAKLSEDEKGQTLTLSYRAAEPAGDGSNYIKTFFLPKGKSRYIGVSFGFGYDDGKKGDSSLPHQLSLAVSPGVFQEPGQVVFADSSKSYWYGGESASEGELDSKGFKELADKAKHEAALKGRVRYVADASNYFGAFLGLSDFPGSVNVVVRPVSKDHDVHQEADDHDKDRTRASITWSEPFPRGGDRVTRNGFLYLGPRESHFVEEDPAGVSGGWAEALTKVQDNQLGFFSVISRGILAFLRILHGWFGNWGWALIVLTICVRLLLFPINRRSQAIMKQHGEAMAKLKPELDKLRKKYEKEPQKLQQEQMKLMKESGVSIIPLGGCLPMLIQLPVFWGLFSALRASIELRQAPWLWVADLSQPDRLIALEPFRNPLTMCCCPIPQPEMIQGLNILPLLMTVTWVLNSYLAPKPSTMDPQQAQQRKMMMFMPLIFGLFMYCYAAGLSLYVLTSSTIGIIETRIINKIWPAKVPLKNVKANGGRGA